MNGLPALGGLEGLITGLPTLTFPSKLPLLRNLINISVFLVRHIFRNCFKRKSMSFNRLFCNDYLRSSCDNAVIIIFLPKCIKVEAILATSTISKACHTSMNEVSNFPILGSSEAQSGDDNNKTCKNSIKTPRFGENLITRGSI